MAALHDKITVFLSYLMGAIKGIKKHRHRKFGNRMDPELQSAFEQAEEAWDNVRRFVESCYCRVGPDHRTTLPNEQNRPALVVPLDYATVVPVIKTRSSFPALSQLFEADLAAMRDICSHLLPFARLCQATDDPQDDLLPFWNNPYFTGMDAQLAYAFARMREPTRIVEIGSGNSTRFFRLAIQDGNLATRLTAIDPNPRLEISKVADEVLTENIVDVPLNLFSSLSVGDILFFDGSHLCFHGTDVTHFFLRVLPAVPRGVLVHVHDIWLPDEYPEHFDNRYYNEQYLLAAFLLNNAEWKALVPVHYLFQKNILLGDGGSFWLKRSLTG